MAASAVLVVSMVVAAKFTVSPDQPDQKHDNTFFIFFILYSTFQVYKATLQVETKKYKNNTIKM